jgi:hypothetical protein
VRRKIGIKIMGNALAWQSSPQIPINSASCLKLWRQNKA